MKRFVRAPISWFTRLTTDQALKRKYASAPTTAEMVDIIMAGRVFDFSVQFANDCFNRLSRKIRSALANNNPDIASEYKKIEKV